MSRRKSRKNDKRQMCKSERKLDEDGKKRKSPEADGEQLERKKKVLIDCTVCMSSVSGLR